MTDTTAYVRPVGAKSIVTATERHCIYQGWQRLLVTPFRTKRQGQTVILYRIHTAGGQWWHNARFASAADAIARAEGLARHWPRMFRVAAPQTSFLQ